MDRLDRLAAGAIGILAMWIGLLVVSSWGEAQGRTAQGVRQTEGQQRVDPQLDRKFEQARTLVDGGNLEQAEALIGALVSEHPFEATPFLLRGDLFFRRDQPVLAMLEYRKAVDLNPDYLDKKAPAFQGKKIRKVVDEARRVLDEGRGGADPETLRNQRRELHYMMRKIAGSCSS